VDLQKRFEHFSVFDGLLDMKGDAADMAVVTLVCSPTIQFDLFLEEIFALIRLFIRGSLVLPHGNYSTNKIIDNQIDIFTSKKFP